VRADEIRFLFGYDRWATRRVLDTLDGLDDAVWSRANDLGDRGLGGILVHHLGASVRWRIWLDTQGHGPELELEPLPTIEELRERWEAEWIAVDAWQSTWSEPLVEHPLEVVPVWQMLVHVVNHGTQHRSEAAALLTAQGRSPGELDLWDFAEEQAAKHSPEV
jgi:uncharacterized damage-inducible protein DinB